MILGEGPPLSVVPAGPGPRAVDDRRATGQFILTGSSVPRVDERRHSGAGRFIHVRMRPMTLAEAGFSSGKVSLAHVLAGGRVATPDPGLAAGDLAERLVCGGWPGLPVRIRVSAPAI